MLNALSAMRLMKTAMVAEPELQNPFTKTSVINPKELNYYGNSQGGIMGTVYCALSQDVTAGVIGVGGGPFGILVGACLLCRVSYRIRCCMYRMRLKSCDRTGLRAQHSPFQVLASVYGPFTALACACTYVSV